MKKTAIQQLRNDIIIEMKLGYISEHSGCRVLNHIDNLYIEEEKEQIKILTDALERIKDWDDEIHSEWDDQGEFASYTLKTYNQTYNNENTNSDSRL
jgi:predicted DNA-binding protein